MPNTYAAPAAAVPGAIQARLYVAPHGNVNGDEIVEFYLGETRCGVVTAPPQAAYDLVTRLEDTPATLNLITPAVAGHVRWWLDDEYTSDADEPDEWTIELIELIKNADEERRRHLGRSYAGYVVTVAIATAPEGLDRLRHLHHELTAVGARTTAQGG